ncbi:phosphonate metabolism protein/1,5-bisphosphokinase (PRPP-forming) PhnN [Mangrovicoccus sp. HB161399]|uniref:phosphonate metabolism protein/1,5-bisphosphokinase (PRPP-forming) PhnN n=1 Tax=Mangrovicoccus sp. HB161399 TaxID=2720392 RepID=UPI001557DAF8|nr:phosphonate metabolism protein/1,5-bisphosphokinase (PRPP-forming) PhnN [Mangrovicoccus sp. HB161399]
MTGTGRLVAVVGASGVGKDSLIRALVRAAPHLVPVRRVITRAPGLGGEDYIAVSEAEFRVREAAGAFCLCWAAHGLRYGIPAGVAADVSAGGGRIANLSRSVLAEAAAVFPRLAVLNVTARPDTLARRLRGRGREDAGEIARRLARAAAPLPPGIAAHPVENDGPIEDTVARALALLAADHA